MLHDTITRAYGAVLLTCATTVAQSGSYVTFGNGCAGSLGVPSLLASRPAIGQTLQLDLNNIPSLALVLFGASNTFWSGGPLPLDLGVIGAPQCFLLVSTEASLTTFASGGSAQVPVAIPNSPGLIGSVFYNQALPLDPTANPLGLIASNGGCATIGGANGGGVAINSLSNNSPQAGQTISAVVGGSNGNPPCIPGFFPIGRPVGGVLQMVAANVPNPGQPFPVMAANFTNFVGLGQGGTAFRTLQGINVPNGAFGGVGTLPVGTAAGQGITATIRGAANPPRQLPVSIDAQGRLCIDFSNTSWVGGERLEIELHFDTQPGTHCDFQATEIQFASAGSAAQCAALSMVWIILQLALDPNCQGFSATVEGDRVYLVAPGGARFVNHYPTYSHVCIK